MKALVVAGGVSQAALVQELKSRGIYTILADRNPNAFAVPYADAFYPVSTLDEEGIYQVALKEKVDFVSKLIGDQDIEVVGADMNDPFYNMNRIEKIQYLMNQEKNQPSIPKEYNREDMQKVAETAKLSRIMKLFENIKNKFSRKDRVNQYGEDAR